MKLKVLVTGAGALLGQGIIKSLRMADTRYEIVAVDPDPRAVGLYWADKAYLVPLAREPSYLDSICRIIERERPHAVLVGTDVELMVLSINKPEIDSAFHTHVIVSPPDIVRIADDKWLTYQFLVSHGFPYIPSALPSDMAHLLRECDFPLVVKPRSGARSVGVHKVWNEQELNRALGSVHNPIVQKCVATPEQEYTSGIVITDGSVRAVVTMRRDLKDGNTYRAYVEPASPFNDLLAKIAERLRGLGSINFQFRSEEGVPKIFEINARFSGTTPLRAYAGFNEVDLIVRHFVCGDPIPTPTLRPMVVLRYWDEIIIDPGELDTLSYKRQIREPKFEHPDHIPM
jgi:carbamoyl-phosphate synthase large subunit